MHEYLPRAKKVQLICVHVCEQFCAHNYKCEYHTDFTYTTESWHRAITQLCGYVAQN